MGWLIALAVILLLAILPLGVSAAYNASGTKVALIAGPLRICLFPRGKKKDKPPKEKKAKAKKQPKPQPVAQEATKPKGGSVKDFIPMVKLGLDFLNTFRRKLRVKCLYLNVVLGGGDPCDLAINYGKAWAALGNLWPRLERFLVIKKRNVEIQCDFEADSTVVDAKLELTITLGRLLALIVVYAIRFLKEFLNFKKKRKGGATT